MESEGERQVRVDRLEVIRYLQAAYGETVPAEAVTGRLAQLLAEMPDHPPYVRAAINRLATTSVVEPLTVAGSL